MNGKILMTLAVFLTLGTTATATDVPPSPAYQCKKTLGAIVLDQNLVIPQNKKCVLDGTIVNGNVTVGLNAFLIAKNGTVIGGDLIGNIPANILLSDTTVGGNLDVFDLGSAGGYEFNCFQLNTSSVGGDVILESTDGRLKVLPGETNPVGECLQVSNNFIGGNVLIEETIETPIKSGPLQFLVTGNNLNGDFVFQSNDVPSSITDNFVGTSLSYLCNTAAGEILRNFTGSDLNYQSEAPAPTVEDNTVSGSTNVVDCL